MLKPNILQILQAGCVIPAHPLALTEENRLDERRQKALTRYYLSAGAGGLAVGVHTTQFQIHDSKIGLYAPVLELAAKTAVRSGTCPIMIAGLVGKTDQAVREARIARDLGYDLGLLSLMSLKGSTIDQLIDHARAVADVIPVMGFYLQRTISGMILPAEFWRRFVEIPNVHAVKIAPFNRYQTLEVLEAVAHSSRRSQIALYTGNDDNIVADLMTEYEFIVDGKPVRLKIVGGLLGQWACWTRRAVELFNQIKSAPSPKLLTLAGQLTLANMAIFDPSHDFSGSIAGISYVLKHQGLLVNNQTLDPAERLSPGQAQRIDEIIRNYPHLTDDDFVREHLSEWLR
jgi:dihydrodipicolinate synthase/N-acetylneuraminate lyase